MYILINIVFPNNTIVPHIVVILQIVSDVLLTSVVYVVKYLLVTILVISMLFVIIVFLVMFIQ